MFKMEKLIQNEFGARLPGVPKGPRGRVAQVEEDRQQRSLLNTFPFNRYIVNTTVHTLLSISWLKQLTVQCTKFVNFLVRVES